MVILQLSLAVLFHCLLLLLLTLTVLFRQLLLLFAVFFLRFVAPAIAIGVV